MSDGPENTTATVSATNNGPPSASANESIDNVKVNGSNSAEEGGHNTDDSGNEACDADGSGAETPKEVVATKVVGTVKWFNVKSGYGFINRNDTKEDVFVHQTAIVKNNPKKAVRSVGDGEVVEFDVVIGEKGNEASNVSGPSGAHVKGSPYAADRRRRGAVGGPGTGAPRGSGRGSGRGFGRGGGGRGKGEHGEEEEVYEEHQEEHEHHEGGGGGGGGQMRGRGRGGGGGYRPRGFRSRYIRRGGPPRSQGGYDGGEMDYGDDSRGRGRGRGTRGAFRPRGRGAPRGYAPRGGAGYSPRGGRGFGGPPRGGRGGFRGGRVSRGRGGFRGQANGESQA